MGCGARWLVSVTNWTCDLGEVTSRLWHNKWPPLRDSKPCISSIGSINAQPWQLGARSGGVHFFPKICVSSIRKGSSCPSGPLEKRHRGRGRWGGEVENHRM